MSSTATTTAWMRNASDELAVANGCEFDAERGAYVVWWIETFCQLYEGEQAGTPLILHGCHECDHQHVHFETWEEAKPHYLERARKHCECYHAGHFIDWQFECLMRLFGWVRWSAKWKRKIRRFRKASIWIAKKNKKSPTLAAVGLYLLAGDGEPGQKVYLAAKDGKQAKDNAGKHTIEMLSRSEVLSEDCSVNKVLSQITHEPTRSILAPMSSSNERTQQSKEGLNGSILVDETHVVDRAFMSRVSRAGISRSEPIQAEFSTAGNNPDGYGKEQFDYAVKVIAGEREDQEFFAAVYAAPQDLSDADLDADPMKYARMANPALGHTVDPEEFLSDYNKSKESLVKLNEFKMYRLNGWQNAANPWLKASDWQKNRRKYTEEDLHGRECYAGLDLARTRDTSALVLVFPEDDGTWKQLAYFWLPKARAVELGQTANYLQFARDGHLVLTDGDEVDYTFIRNRIFEISERFNLAKIVYDQTYAAQLMQRLVDEDGMQDVREVFPQTIMAFAGPTAAYERELIGGRLHHNGNGLLSWQSSHVTVRTDVSGNMRPVKPKHKDGRTIDGIAAGVMALAAAMSRVEEVSWYTPGMWTRD